MGVYNPHVPQVLGQEWVPIRNEDLFLSPAQNVVEVGHEFTATATRIINNGRFYVNQLPQSSPEGTAYSITIYPAGLSDQTGPISYVDIPVTNGGITGNASVGGTGVADSLANPADNLFVTLSGGTPDDANVDMFFGTNQYSQLLNGKRIVALQLVYVASSDDFSLFEARMSLTSNLTSNVFIYALSTDGSIVATQLGPGAPEYEIIDLGEVSAFWSTTPYTTSERLPWTYATLQRFEASSANRIITRFEGIDNPSGTAMFLRYVALRVIYCEEKRVAVGGVSYAGTAVGGAFGGTNDILRLGANVIPMRTLALAANPSLAAGDYEVVLSSPDVGATLAKDDPYPLLNALRELREILPHEGIQVNVTTTTGDTFTVEQTHVLPQISLHTSSGPLTEVHVYGRQAVAQVYGTITATQEILDTGISAATYPQVRYYARRFGDTTVSLLLDSPTIVGSSVSITPTEFDTLDEIIDGWKEVNLTFSTPPSMGAGTNPQWRWSASGETNGNRWEVLGATAPALSGIPGNFLNLVPSPNQLSTATYGQPSAGSTINLGWVPQYAPPVSATADDQTSDAVILFAQDMPTVTGLAVVGMSQALTGIGQDCGVDPCCVPTDLLYHRITWSPTSSGIAVTGFGYYQLQRMDTIDGDWATIMQDSSPFASGFNDFEARVGILTSYRIRALNDLLFTGPWSSTVTITTPSPGVSGGCLDGGHVLMFTSNERQNGAINLAYSNAWENQRVQEDFTFPEANMVQLQAMYNKDFFTAFRPTERGGETFERTILVQAAAISPPTLADFRSLRDMAWEDVSYICVRDEEGNRWFATVLVPSGKVTHFRRLYMAQVRVVEVTSTPSPVDPSS